MTGVGRFLFDECVGKPVMVAIHQLVQTTTEFVHICDYFRQGVLDTDWVPRIGREGGWVVITSDGGKHSRRGEKLPDVCRDHGVTHVVLSAKLHVKKSREKATAIASMWGRIEKLGEEPAGTRYRLRYKEVKGQAKLVIALEKVESVRKGAVPTAGGDATSEDGGSAPASPSQQEP